MSFVRKDETKDETDDELQVVETQTYTYTVGSP